MNHATCPRIIACAALAACVFAPSAHAQPGVVPGGAKAPQQGAPVVIPQPAPTTRPAYESLIKKDAAGKIIRVSGSLDAVALQRNPSVDDAARAAMAPVVADWTAEVNQVVIDNLDFVEAIEGGLMESYDVNDAGKTRYVQQMNVQLSAAGPLSARLTQKSLLSGPAAGLNMQITNEYIQAVFNEINSTPPPPGANGAPAQPQQYGNAAAVNRFFTALSSRDACEQYRKMLLDAAPLVDRILPELTPDARAKAAPGAAAVKAATDDTARMIAVRDMIKPLSFDDRRAFLSKAVGLGAAPDPFHPAPEFPRAADAAPAAPKPN